LREGLLVFGVRALRNLPWEFPHVSILREQRPSLGSGLKLHPVVVDRRPDYIYISILTNSSL
jgi:hypothetical protein